MLNLPINSKVCENVIWHGGNHKSVGNPHNQYVSKFSRKNSAINTTANVYAKIAHIEWTPNSALSMLYEFDLYDLRSTSASIKCKISIYGPNLSEFTSDMSDNFTPYLDFDSVNHTCDVYVKISKHYRPVYYQLTRAVTSQKYDNNNVDDEYAIRCITLYDNAELLNSVTYTDSPSYTSLIYNDTVTSNITGATCKLKAEGRTIQLTCKWNVAQNLSTGWSVLIVPGGIPEEFRPIETFEFITVSSNNVPVQIGIKDTGEVVANPMSAISANSAAILFNATWVK